MKRYGSVLGIKPEAIAEYKRLHAAVWPDVLAQIARSNIRNYSIYLKEPENLLFSYFEYHGADFAELAKSYSESDTRTEGGDLGFVQAGNLVDTLASVVTGMDPGDIRGPVRTETGWEVLQLVEWKAGNLRPYAEVKEQLRRQLYDAQVAKATESWVKELRRKAHIDVK